MSPWLAVIGIISMKSLCILLPLFELKQISRIAHMVGTSFRGRSTTNSSVNSSYISCSHSMRIWAPSYLVPLAILEGDWAGDNDRSTNIRQVLYLKWVNCELRDNHQTLPHTQDKYSVKIQFLTPRIMFCEPPTEFYRSSA